MPNPTQPPTMPRFVPSTEVARLAGVSQSAVSRTFTPGASVSAQTREKVLRAAAALGYRPNNIPRIMLTGRSQMVGVVVGGLDNPYYAAVLDRFCIALREAGQQVMLVRSETGLALDGVLQQLAAYRVDAVLTAVPVRTEAAAAALSSLRTPIICFNADVTTERVLSVRSDNYETGRGAARLLHSTGAQRFAFIGGPPVHTASRSRGRGFSDALAELGLPGPVEFASDDSYDGGFSAASAIFAAAERPDGLFCSNDLMACGAIDALRVRHGLSVPNDVRVVGCDNIAQAAWSNYTLSSFDQQPDAMIAAAFDLLSTMEDGVIALEAERIRVVPARLVERRSTTKI